MGDKSGDLLAALKERFSYDPDTGKISKNGKAVGSRSGRYMTVSVGGRQVPYHVAAWALATGEWRVGQIDHRNRDPMDNRLANLRVVDASQQQANRGLFKNNKSGFRGVYRHKNGWRVQIRCRGKLHDIGFYREIEEAATQAQLARRRIWGAHASPLVESP